MRTVLLSSSCLMILISGCSPAAKVSTAPAPTSQAAEKPTAENLRVFLDSAVAKANADAADLAGKTLYQRIDYRRTVYFVPEPKPATRKAPKVRVEQRNGQTVIVVDPPEPMPEIEIPDGPYVDVIVPPDNAVKSEWVDTYFMAQKFNCRFEVASVGPLRPGEGKGGILMEADVALKLSITRRIGEVAGDEKAIPHPPEGMKYWYPTSSISRLFGHGGGGLLRNLLKIPVPELAEPTGPLAQKALDSMLASTEQEEETTLTVKAVYHPRTQRWYFRTLQIPGPTVLDDPRKSELREQLIYVDSTTTRPAAGK